jgi:hypothetical protein
MVGRIEGPAAHVVDDGANGDARQAQYFWKFWLIGRTVIARRALANVRDATLTPGTIARDAHAALPQGALLAVRGSSERSEGASAFSGPGIKTRFYRIIADGVGRGKARETARGEAHRGTRLPLKQHLPTK